MTEYDSYMVLVRDREVEEFDTLEQARAFIRFQVCENGEFQFSDFEVEARVRIGAI